MSEQALFSPEERENFKNAFDAFDEDRDDLVETKEIGKLLRAIGFNPMPEEVEDMIEDIDAPKFDFNSFLYIIYRHARECDPEQELIDAFRVFDKDGSGKLKTDTIREILRHLKKPFTEDQINELLSNATIDKQDCIRYEDFVKVMLDF